MQQRRTTGWIAIGLGLALGLAACGTAASEAPPTGASGTQGASSAPVVSDAPGATDPPTNPDVGPLNTAVVTIGSDRYEFTDVKCSIFVARYIQAGNFGADPEVSIVLPPEGWEAEGDTFSPPSVQVKIGDPFAGGQTWYAGDYDSPVAIPIPDGSSQIDSYTVPEGRPVKATGTATFIDLAAHELGKEAAVATGSFEVSCP